MRFFKQLLLIVDCSHTYNSKTVFPGLLCKFACKGAVGHRTSMSTTVAVSFIIIIII